MGHLDRQETAGGLEKLANCRRAAPEHILDLLLFLTLSAQGLSLADELRPISWGESSTPHASTYRGCRTESDSPQRKPTKHDFSADERTQRVGFAGQPASLVWPLNETQRAP